MTNQSLGIGQLVGWVEGADPKEGNKSTNPPTPSVPSPVQGKEVPRPN